MPSLLPHSLLILTLLLPHAAQADCADLTEVYPQVAEQVVRIQAPNEGEDLGSGFLMRPDEESEVAWVVTNAHVLGGYESLKVRGNGHGPWEASLLGRDSAMDLAILQLEAPSQLVGLPLRRSPMAVGESIWAMGSPFGLEASLASGYLGALGRYFTAEPSVPYLQLDMTLNPGGSGGPVLDRKGRVIGVNTQVLGRQENQAGLAFAIPAWVLERYLARLYQHGDESGYLGVYLEAREEPLLAETVVEDSPAYRAGIRSGDRLYSAEPGPERQGEFRHRLLMPLPGELLRLTREGEDGERETVTLSAQSFADGNRSIDWLGIQARRHAEGGLKVVNVTYPQTLLEDGDRLIYQGRRSLSHPFDLNRPAGDKVPLLVERDGERFFVAAPVLD